jgi:hypothetical protein
VRDLARPLYSNRDGDHLASGGNESECYLREAFFVFRRELKFQAGRFFALTLPVGRAQTEIVRIGI